MKQTELKGGKNMTNELKNRIRIELNRAFVHCGETDSEILNEKVENEIETLMCFMAGSYPKTIQTNDGDLSGYTIDIAVGSGTAKGEVVALQMVVAKGGIHYILHSHISTKPDGWRPGDKMMIENECNRIVALDDVDPAIFN